MSQTNHSSIPFPIADELLRALMVRFLAELMEVTGNPQNAEDFQAALQTYCDSLQPWRESGDGPPNPRAAFSLFENYTFDETGEHITVELSPEAEALFRAWLRRHKVWVRLASTPPILGGTDACTDTDAQKMNHWRCAFHARKGRAATRFAAQHVVRSSRAC